MSFLEVFSIVLCIIPLVYIVYLCRISIRRGNNKNLWGSIALLVSYALLIISANEPLPQIIVTLCYSVIARNLLKKYLDLINAEYRKELAASYRADFEEYAYKPRRRKK